MLDNVVASVLGAIAGAAAAKAIPFHIAPKGRRAMRDLHIRNVFDIPGENEMRDRRMREAFSEQTGFMYLLARSGFHCLHPHGQSWNYQGCEPSQDCGVHRNLEKGITTRVVLEDPYSLNGECRRRAEGGTLPWQDVPFTQLAELNDKYHGNLEISFTAAPILCSLFITESSAFYDPYHLGTFRYFRSSGFPFPLKNNFLVIEFDKGPEPEGRSFYHLLKSHFEFIRGDQLTMPFQKFEKKYAKRLRPDS